MKSPSPDADSEDSPAAVLYEQHGPLIFAWLLKQTHSWEDAEDLLLEVFLAAVEHNRLLAVPGEKRLAWLLSVAQHKLVDYYRQAGRRQHVPLDAMTDTLEAEEALAPEAVALRRERHADLHAALQGLSATQREVVQLRFGKGLRCAEIATVLGKREGAVYILLWCALAFLRALRQRSGRKRQRCHTMTNPSILRRLRASTIWMSRSSSACFSARSRPTSRRY